MAQPSPGRSPSADAHPLDAGNSSAQRQFFDDQEAELGQRLTHFLSQTSAVLQAATVSAEPVAAPKTERLFNHKRLPDSWKLSLAQASGGPASARIDPGAGSNTRRRAIERELLEALYSHARTRKYVSMLLWYVQQNPPAPTDGPKDAQKAADRIRDALARKGIDLPIATLLEPTHITL